MHGKLAAAPTESDLRKKIHGNGIRGEISMKLYYCNTVALVGDHGRTPQNTKPRMVLDAFRNAQEALSAQLLMERLPADVNRSDISVARSLEDMERAFVPCFRDVKFYALCEDAPNLAIQPRSLSVHFMQSSRVPGAAGGCADLNQYRVDEAQVLGQCATCMR